MTPEPTPKDQPARNRLQLPSKEEIAQIRDVPILHQWEADIEAAIAKIQVDLDFVDGDAEWHSRARNALAFHSIALKAVRKQIRGLTGKREAHEQLQLQQKAVKAAKREAHAKRMEAAAQAKDAKAKADAVKVLQRKIDFLEKTSLLAVFHRLCAERLPTDLYWELVDLAASKVQQSMALELDMPQ